MGEVYSGVVALIALVVVSAAWWVWDKKCLKLD